MLASPRNFSTSASARAASSASSSILGASAFWTSSVSVEALVGELVAIGLSDAVGDRGREVGIDRREADADEAALLGRIDLEPIEKRPQGAVLIGLLRIWRSDADHAQDARQRVGRAAGAVELRQIGELHLADDGLGEVRRHQRADVRVHRFLVHADADAVGGAVARGIGERIVRAFGFDRELRFRDIERRNHLEDAEGRARQDDRNDDQPLETSGHGSPDGFQVDVVGTLDWSRGHVSRSATSSRIVRDRG